MDLPGVIVAPEGIVWSGLGPHFERLGTPQDNFFQSWQRFCLKYENNGKTWVFPWFFNDLRSPEGVKMSGKPERIKPGGFWNTRGSSGMRKIGSMGCTSGRFGPNGASTVAPGGRRRDLTRQQPGEPGRRGGVGEGIIFMYMTIRAHSTRPEARGLGRLSRQGYYKFEQSK